MNAQELKNSILQLAIQGKLVEQRKEEGTAEELYQQIQEEKTKLIKEGKIKKEKLVAKISGDEIPFEIPESWKWVRIGAVIDIVRGASPRPIKEFITESDDGVNWIKIGDTEKGSKYINKTNEKITFEGMKKSRYVKKGDFLLSNSMSFGRPYILNIDGCIHDGWLALSQLIEIFDKEFLYYLLSSSMVYYQFCGRVSGAVVNNLNSDKVKLTVVPIPPLEEQKRIVAKIEELLQYIEKYGEAHSKLEVFNKKFPEDMQKSILQHAIQGKLVEQRKEEGTAEELYQQIQDEKARLIKEGKIKKEKPLADITEDEIPFEIPESWKWVRLGNIIDIIRGASPRPIKEFITESEDGISWIKIGDSEKGSKYISKANEKITVEGMKKSRYVKKGDFLLSNSMSFGRPYILSIDGCIHDGWLALSQLIEIFDKEYLYYLLSSSMVYYQFCGRVSGAVVNNLNSDKVKLTVVPLPPLEEQKRIVAKIEEMIPYCQQLVK